MSKLLMSDPQPEYSGNVRVKDLRRTSEHIITQKFEFDMGHRLLDHEGHCRHLHGHRYVLEASFSSDALNALGFVVDFGTVKRLVKDKVINQYDHNFAFHKSDPLLVSEFIKMHGRDPIVLPNNPSAENVIRALAYDIIELCAEEQELHPTHLVYLSLWETPNCQAEWWPE